MSYYIVVHIMLRILNFATLIVTNYLMIGIYILSVQIKTITTNCGMLGTELLEIVS